MLCLSKADIKNSVGLLTNIRIASVLPSQILDLTNVGLLPPNRATANVEQSIASVPNLFDDLPPPLEVVPDIDPLSGLRRIYVSQRVSPFST